MQADTLTSRKPSGSKTQVFTQQDTIADPSGPSGRTDLGSKPVTLSRIFILTGCYHIHGPFISTSILSVTSLLVSSSSPVGRGNPSRARRSARRRIDALSARGVRKCGSAAGCCVPELGRVGGDLTLASGSESWSFHVLFTVKHFPDWTFLLL
ncbi:hypothetical protein STEG23_002883 [Scotinomys teguina]